MYTFFTENPMKYPLIQLHQPRVMFSQRLYAFIVVKQHISYINTHSTHHENNNKYNFDPLKPHFYIVKLGFAGVYIIFLISAKNIDCGYSLEPPRRGGTNEYPQSMFLAEIWKNIRVFVFENFQFFGGEIFYIFE